MSVRSFPLFRWSCTTMQGRGIAVALPALVVLSLYLSLLLPCATATVSPIVVRGRHLVDSVTQRRFFVKGSGYDYDVSNSNAKHWRPAINALLNAAPHINTIRLYEVDPTLQYDEFMTAMNRRDIFVIVPLTPAKDWCTLNRDGTPSLTTQPTCYPSCLLNHAQHVVNLFHPHSNVLLFTVGNEILNSGVRWAAAACIKSFTRDVKRFMRQCESEESSRRVPLLYAAADNAMTGFTAEENDRLKSDYLTCGDDDDARIDVMGVNMFRFCSDTCSFHSCESNKVAAAFNTASLPVLLTEYGCGDFSYHINHTQQVGVNPFTETALLYSPLMAASFSGGCAYTYGVRGGESFAFFEGGGRGVSGEAGLVKRCGYPDGLCRVDAYERQLAAVEERERQRVEEQRKRKLAGEAEEELDESEGGGEEGGAATCPVLLGVDLTMADSRQGADGYDEVACQAGVGKSATVEQERERQDRELEQQKLDQAEEKERKRKLAERGDDDGVHDNTNQDQPGADARQQPVDESDAGGPQQPQQEQNNTSSHRSSLSKPSPPPIPSDDEIGGSDGSEREDGQNQHSGKQSTGEEQHALARWQLLAFLCALVVF